MSKFSAFAIKSYCPVTTRFCTCVSTIAVDRRFNCAFEDAYICGYATAGVGFVWKQVKGLDVNDGIGPRTDRAGSFLGMLNQNAI